MFITAEEYSWLHENKTPTGYIFRQLQSYNITDYVETGPHSPEHIFKQAVELRISPLKLSRNSILKKMTI